MELKKIQVTQVQPGMWIKVMQKMHVYSIWQNKVGDLLATGAQILLHVSIWGYDWSKYLRAALLWLGHYIKKDY